MTNLKRAVLSGVFGIILSLPVIAQVTAYPERAQPPEKAAADKASCEEYAKSKTGFDPQEAIMAEAPPEPPPEQKQKIAKKIRTYNDAETECLKSRGYAVGS